MFAVAVLACAVVARQPGLIRLDVPGARGAEVKAVTATAGPGDPIQPLLQGFPGAGARITERRQVSVRQGPNNPDGAADPMPLIDVGGHGIHVISQWSPGRFPNIHDGPTDGGAEAPRVVTQSGSFTLTVYQQHYSNFGLPVHLPACTVEPLLSGPTVLEVVFDSWERCVALPPNTPSNWRTPNGAPAAGTYVQIGGTPSCRDVSVGVVLLEAMFCDAGCTQCDHVFAPPRRISPDDSGSGLGSGSGSGLGSGVDSGVDSQGCISDPAAAPWLPVAGDPTVRNASTFAVGGLSCPMRMPYLRLDCYSGDIIANRDLCASAIRRLNAAGELNATGALLDVDAESDDTVVSIGSVDNGLCGVLPADNQQPFTSLGNCRPVFFGDQRTLADGDGDDTDAAEPSPYAEFRAICQPIVDRPSHSESHHRHLHGDPVPESGTVPYLERCEDSNIFCGDGGCDIDDCCGTPLNPATQSCCAAIYCTCVVNGDCLCDLSSTGPMAEQGLIHCNGSRLAGSNEDEGATTSWPMTTPPPPEVTNANTPSDCGAGHVDCGANGDLNAMCFDRTRCFCGAGYGCGGDQATTCTPEHLNHSVCIPATESLTTQPPHPSGGRASAFSQTADSGVHCEPGYDLISTPEACRAAAVGLGLAFQRLVHLDMSPIGCFVIQTVVSFYNPTHPDSAPQLQPGTHTICQAPGATPAPTPTASTRPRPRPDANRVNPSPSPSRPNTTPGTADSPSPPDTDDTIVSASTPAPDTAPAIERKVVWSFAAGLGVLAAVAIVIRKYRVWRRTTTYTLQPTFDNPVYEQELEEDELYEQDLDGGFLSA